MSMRPIGAVFDAGVLKGRHCMRRFTSLLLVLTMLFTMAPGLSFAGTPSTDAGTLVGTAAEFKTALADSSVATITLSADIDSTEQLTVSRPVAINGADKTLKVTTDLGKVNGSKHALFFQAGITGNPIVVSNLTIDSNSMAYGVSTYNAAVVTLNKVTIKNSRGAGLTVNGSNVTATDFATSGNAWGAVNVDPGVGVTTPSVFTMVSGTLGEANKIWADNANVTATATVKVVAPGFGSVNTGTKVAIWNVLRTVSVDSTTTLIAAIRDLQAGDTLNLAPGIYDVERFLGDMTFGAQGGSAQTGWYLPIWQPGVTLKGAGADKTILTSSVNSANGSWASQDFITVWANGVTIDGVTLKSKVDTNKAIEVMGKNFTLKNTKVMTNPAGPEIGAEFYKFSGSVYFSPLTPITGALGDVGNSRLENVLVEGAWLRAGSDVTTGTISLKDVTLDWVEAGYAPLGFGMMSINNAFKVESNVKFLVDATILDLKAQVLSRMPAGAELVFKGANSNWTFPAGTFDGSAITTFSPGVTATPLAYSALKEFMVEFAQSGDLPGTATVKVALGTDFAGKTFDLHKFVSGAALGALVERVTVDADGNATLSVDRGDIWFLYEYRQSTVSFHSDGGSAVASQMVDYNGFADEPMAPTKTGSTFQGWFTDAGFAHNANFTADKITEPTTLYAKFTLNPYVPIRPRLLNPIAPSVMYHSRSAMVYGYLRPLHKAGTSPVRIYMYKYVSGTWKSYGFSNATASNYSTSTTKYSRSMRLPSAGKWRLRAYAPADAAHAAVWSSGCDYVTVK